MNKIITFILCFILAVPVVAQDESSERTKGRPVRAPFSSGLLMDNQTSVIYAPKTLEYAIQHKFGSIQNGRSDLYGLYAPAYDIRLGLVYVPVRNFQVGYGLSKRNMYSDFSAKWTIFEQTREETMPVAVTLYGNFAIDGRSSELFKSRVYNHSSDPYHPFNAQRYRFSQRYSYFSQLIIGRRFNDWLSLQTAVSFTHFNLSERTGDHDKIGAHFNGRIKFSPQSAVLFAYDAPLKIKEISEQREFINHPMPTLSVAWEVATSTHAFQIYLSSASSILPQDNILYNQNDWRERNFSIGFVITRLWGF